MNGVLTWRDKCDGVSMRRPRRPVPVVVFGVEEEVGTDDGDAQGDDDEDEEHEEEEPVNVIHLVVPDGGEDEVRLDEDGAEGEQPAHDGDDGGVQIPLLLRDGARDGLHAARVVGHAAPQGYPRRSVLHATVKR